MASKPERHCSKPRIGVSGNHRVWSPSWFCIRLAIKLAGGIPVRISVAHPHQKERLDGLVVSGGDDIHPSLYGAESLPTATYDQPRDDLELDLIHYALQEDLPMLGICRGHQLINVALGGSLLSDIRELRHLTSNFGTILPRKTALITDHSDLYNLLTENRIRINSLHHQAVEKPGEGLTVVGKDLDDFVQAVECPTRRIMGVQWHPEYLVYQRLHRKLFVWLVAQANQVRGD